MKNKLIVSGAPHIVKGASVRRIMWAVILSLVPAGIAGVGIFGQGALRMIIAGVAAAVVTEALLQKARGRRVSISDGSAVLTGLLLAYNLPPNAPLWLPVAGSIFAIAVGKQVFGGLGQNIFNPALTGRVFLMASWPQYMTNFSRPFAADAASSATPLMRLKEGMTAEHITYIDLLLGKRGGCIGEVCTIALLAGAAFLLARRYISWHIPASYIATTGVMMYLFGPRGMFSGDWLFHILSGGLILGAFFMATDYVTSPLTRTGQIVFGAGCGLLTATIRLWGGYPEGVSYAILMMNAAVPMIDRHVKNRVYGRA